MEQHGNKSTYNIETVLRKNIVDSEYWRNTCAKLQTWEEVVDQIFYDVIHVEPWMSGNARGASSAFGLLYRLCQLQPSEEQVDALLTHEDSPYIRAIGFLYLRYVGDPKQLWAWLRPYVQDSEEISPSGESGTAVTVGDYVRDVFLEQYYFETIFPRIPKPVNDEWVGKLRGMGLPAKAVGNGGQGGPDRRGLDEPNRRPASVKASLSVAFGQRAPNRATAREEGRGLGAGMKNVYNGTREERPRSSSRDARTAAEKRPAEAAPYAQAHGRHHRDRKTDSDRDRYSKRYCSRDPAHDADARPPRVRTNEAHVKQSDGDRHQSSRDNVSHKSVQRDRGSPRHHDRDASHRANRHHTSHYTSSRQEHMQGSRSPKARRSSRDWQAIADTSAFDAANLHKSTAAYGSTSVRSHDH